MTNRDKIVIAFLVSLGMFSASQASAYVSSLSSSQKIALASAASDSSGALPATGSGPTEILPTE